MGVILHKQGSNAGDGVLSDDYLYDYLLRGYAFALEENFTIASLATMYILIDYTTYTDFSLSNIDVVRTKRKGIVYVSAPRMTATDAPVLVTVYRGTDYSGGTSVLYSKRNTLSDIEPQITVTKDATGTVKGDPVLNYLVGARSTQTSSGGNANVGVIPFIRCTKDKTLVEVINDSGAEIIFSYGQTFYEL